jgi:hypothetical protein
MEEEAAAVVIDCGSGTIFFFPTSTLTVFAAWTKVGFGGETRPLHVIPTIIGEDPSSIGSFLFGTDGKYKN